MARHCPPIRLITVDVGWAVNQTDSPSQSPWLGTAHQRINHSRCRVRSQPDRFIKKRDRIARHWPPTD
ncbi:hypothetical protein [Moorena sp. SIO3I6]|uniref:hypothetical protein n=1 Tax=Moorena sp. SIO3I6 TaxID=2607831 RepID=UPI0013F6B740|nr:hypothetical protein [Moorena sp. SIO3I6]NEP29223.1 hypothetical protein [Moorena sp. SIO3I6]